SQKRDDRREGWYLSGVVVEPAYRRYGIGGQLTRWRMDWLSDKANEVFYFANSLNRASIDLHHKFGFDLILRNIHVPGCLFSGAGEGLRFRASLPLQTWPSAVCPTV